VIYELGEAGAIGEDPALTVRLPPLASSFTPPGAECLGRGKSYAWSLRAIYDSERSGWAEALFFSVPGGPSDEDLRAALEVVRAYAARRNQDPRTAEPGRQPGTDDSGAGRDAEAAAPADSRTRTARAGAIVAFRVRASGDVEASSFSGDGSGLRNIGSAALAIDAVGPSEIAENAVSSDEIIADAVGSSEITSAAVGPSEIASNAVGASEMAGNFCLVKRGPDLPCPAGYTEFSIKWDTEDGDNGDFCTEEVATVCPTSSLNSFIYLGFCCA
jgi:hypothetical protein